MKHLKYAVLAALILVLAACQQVAGPEGEISTLDTIVVNDVVAVGTTLDRAPGYVGTASFYLLVNDNLTDNINGCNASGSAPVRVTVTSSNPDVTIASPGYLDFTECAEMEGGVITNYNAQSIGYTVNNDAQAGSVKITGDGAGGKKWDGSTGQFTAGEFSFNIVVSSLSFGGLQDPYGADKAFKRGRTLPLKWEYLGSNGKPADTGDVSPTVSITAAITETCPTNPITDSDYSMTNASGLQYDGVSMWQYNLDTKGLAAGCYNITITRAGAETASNLPLRIVR